MKDGKKLSWWKIMWGNGYLLAFTLALAGIIFVICTRDTFNGTIEFLVPIAILGGVVVSVSYLGFYKFWKKLKNLEKNGDL